MRGYKCVCVFGDPHHQEKNWSYVPLRMIGAKSQIEQEVFDCRASLYVYTLDVCILLRQTEAIHAFCHALPVFALHMY